MSLAHGLSIVLIFSKNQLLVLLIFALVSILFHLFLIWFLLFLSLYSLWLSSVLLFLVALGVKLGYLFDVPLVSRFRLILQWTSLLALLLLNPTGFGLLCFNFHLFLCIFLLGFHGTSGVKKSTCNAETWILSLGGEDPWRSKQLPIPVFCLREFHGLYSPWACKDLDTTEQLTFRLIFLFPLWSIGYSEVCCLASICLYLCAYVSRGVLLWIYPVWDSLGFLDFGGYFLPHFRESFEYHLLKYSSCPFILSPSSRTPMIWMLDCLTLSQGPLRLSSFNTFFFFSPLCFIYFHHSIFRLTDPIFCHNYSTVGSLQSAFNLSYYISHY